MVNIFLNNFVLCDWPEYKQVGLQDPATPMMEGMINFHHYIMFYIIFIGVFVFCILADVIRFFEEHSKEDKRKKGLSFSHNTSLEVIWTIIPAIILLVIAIPSFTLLYSLDDLTDPRITLKIIGHQWYWSYELSDYATNKAIGDLKYDTYLMPYESYSKQRYDNAFRLLLTDTLVVLPTRTHIRLLVTSADVIHSWAIPSFGIKVDACPGRLSQAFLYINRYTPTNKWRVFFGQCSEICGVNHGFMPITVRAVSMREYISVISKKK